MDSSWRKAGVASSAEGNSSRRRVSKFQMAASGLAPSMPFISSLIWVCSRAGLSSTTGTQSGREKKEREGRLITHPGAGGSCPGFSTGPVQTGRPDGPVHSSHPSGPGKRTAEPPAEPAASGGETFPFFILPFTVRENPPSSAS